MVNQWIHSDNNVNHTHRPSLIVYQHNLDLEIALDEITFKVEICDRIENGFLQLLGSTNVRSHLSRHGYDLTTSYHVTQRRDHEDSERPNKTLRYRTCLAYVDVTQ